MKNIVLMLISAFFVYGIPISPIQAATIFSPATTELTIPITDAGTLGFFSVQMRLFKGDPVTFELISFTALTESPTQADAVYNAQTGHLSISTVTVGNIPYSAELQAQPVDNVLHFQLTRLSEQSLATEVCQ